MIILVLFTASVFLFNNGSTNLNATVTLDPPAVQDASHVCVTAGAFRAQEPGAVRVRWYDSATQSAPIAETWLEWHPNVLTTVKSCVPLDAWHDEHAQVTLQAPDVVPGVPYPLLRGIRIHTEQQAP